MKHRGRGAESLALALLASALAFAPAPVPGIDYTWTGNGSGTNWSVPANWSPSGPPGPVSSGTATNGLIFSGTAGQSNYNNLAFGYYSNITFLNGGFSIAGQNLGLSAGNLNCTGTNTIGGLVRSGSGTRLINTAAGGQLTIGSGGIAHQGGTVQEKSSGVTIINGGLAGSAGSLFRIFSFGQTVLGGDSSSFGGSIHVYRFARLTHAKGLGGSTTTVTLDRSYNDAYVDLNGLNVPNVNVTFANAEQPGGTRLARLRNTSATPASFSGNLSTTSSNNVGVDGSGDLLLSGVISGTNGLTKLDGGSFTLLGTNTYSGLTTVSGGTLLVNGAVGTNSVTVTSGARIGGTGMIGGKVSFHSGALALFTVGSPLNISGSLTASNNVVSLNLPGVVGAGTYRLANYNVTGSSGSFHPTPGIASGGPFAANTTNFITTAGGQVNLVVQNLPLNYLAWANSWGLDTSVGADTNDVDGDGYANLYEFAVGGNPTNSADWGQSPAIGLTSGGMQYVYTCRSDDTNLLYSLQTKTNLAPARWTNTGYIVTGTNVTGGVFNYVTNLIPTTNASGFVRLAVDYPDCLAAFVPIPYVSFVVTSYGATGNGVSDDTAAIQAAIDAANVNGGVVWFPSGVYRITAPLVLNSPKVSLLGRGAGELPCASIIKAGATMPAMLITSNIHNISIESLVFDGGADQGRSIACALDLQDFLGSRVGQVAIRNVTGHGIHSRWVQSTALYSWVNWFVNHDISVGGYALRLGSSDSYIVGVNVTGGLGMTEELFAGNVYRNCVFRGCTNGITTTNQSGSLCHLSVTDCTFINNSQYGISFSFPTADFKAYTTVDCCVFEGNGQADVVLNNASRVALRRNEFRTTAPTRGQAIHTSGTSDRVTVTDNRFALASQTLLGVRSVLASNIFSCTTWDSTAGAFPREDLLLLPSGGAVHNVKSAAYNAAGNGSADDTAELQAALNAANPGDTVYFPAGAYKITQPLQLTRSGVLLLGDGRSHTGGARIVAGVNLASMLTTPSQVSGLRMAKLSFVGGATYAVTNALLFSRLTDSQIDHIQVLDASGNAIVLGTNSARITLRNCQAQKPVGFGIILEGQDCVVDSAYVSCAGPYGIRIAGPGGHQILNTHVDLETTAGIYLTAPSPNNAPVTIRNCYFDCGNSIPPNAAIQVDYSQPQTAHLSVEACVFRSNGVDLKLNNATHVSWTSSASSVRSAGQGGTVHLQTSGTVDYLNIIGNAFGNTISFPGANSVVYGNTTP